MGHRDVSHTLGWRHCDADTAAAGVDCARAPRQSCAHGTHDHLVRLDAYRRVTVGRYGLAPAGFAPRCPHDPRWNHDRER